MHPAARAFALDRLGGRVFGHVIEIGGRDVNGTIRTGVLADKYVSVDLRPGPGVDVVADGRSWRPTCLADLVLCLEVLEHCEHWRDLVANMAAMLRPGGELILTCATDQRAPHSGLDGGMVRAGEWYGNVGASDLLSTFCQAGLMPLVTMVRDNADLYAHASKV